MWCGREGRRERERKGNGNGKGAGDYGVDRGMCCDVRVDWVLRCACGGQHC